MCLKTTPQQKNNKKQHEPREAVRESESYFLRIFQHTPGTYPKPPTNSLWRNSFHLGLWGCLGYAPGVCWGSLRYFCQKKTWKTYGTMTPTTTRQNPRQPQQVCVFSPVFSAHLVEVPHLWVGQLWTSQQPKKQDELLNPHLVAHLLVI